MLRRKIEEVLQGWKEKEKHKPLIIKGCRQCGKTYSVLKFAKENYSNVVYLNFVEQPLYKDIFTKSLDVDDLIMTMSATVKNFGRAVPGETIIIFDEIQECPGARTSLKFFSQDGRYDVVATGSLLGISGYSEKVQSVPVGYEAHVTMYPLCFEEFLWANGMGDDVIKYLRKCLEEQQAIVPAIHQRMQELLKQYVIIGGMPEVVNTFLATKQINLCVEVQRDILDSYREDMIKYGTQETKGKIVECFVSIPKQLAKENKKFQYSVIHKHGSSSKFAGSLQWIEDAGIINRCYNLSALELPLAGQAVSDVFKVYMADTGLFVSMLEEGTQRDILQGNLLGYKGAIFENLIADIFGKMGRKLYYYRKDSGLEIDFVIKYKGKCTLVEVKATNGNAKSMNTVMKQYDRYHVDSGIKLGNYNIGCVGNVLTLPLYMAFLLESDTNQEIGIKN